MGIKWNDNRIDSAPSIVLQNGKNVSRITFNAPAYEQHLKRFAKDGYVHLKLGYDADKKAIAVKLYKEAVAGTRKIQLVKATRIAVDTFLAENGINLTEGRHYDIEQKTDDLLMIKVA